MGNPRRANGHRRDQVVRRVKAEESDCWLCGQPVDKTLGPYLPDSPEVDEVIPVHLGGSPFDRSNCHLSHRRCNNDRNHVRVEPVTTGRNWGT